MLLKQPGQDREAMDMDTVQIQVSIILLTRQILLIRLHTRHNIPDNKTNEQVMRQFDEYLPS